MTINIELIAAFISALGVIATPFYFVLKKYNTIINRLDSIERWTKSQQRDIQDEKENRFALNKSLLLIARSMKAQGYNHTIDGAIENLEETIFRQQVDGVSYLGKEENE